VGQSQQEKIFSVIYRNFLVVFAPHFLPLAVVCLCLFFRLPSLFVSVLLLTFRRLPLSAVFSLICLLLFRSVFLGGSFAFARFLSVLIYLIIFISVLKLII